jgi:hypothetical protein
MWVQVDDDVPRGFFEFCFDPHYKFPQLLKDVVGKGNWFDAEEALAAGKYGTAVMFSVVTIIIALVVAFVSFEIWKGKFIRRERRIKRKSWLPEYEEKIEELSATISLLQSNNRRLEESVGVLVSAVQASVAFDRAVVVGSAGGKHEFKFLGCELKPDVDGFWGYYECPVCRENLITVHEKENSDEPFREHLGLCPGLNRAMIAEV